MWCVQNNNLWYHNHDATVHEISYSVNQVIMISESQNHINITITEKTNLLGVVLDIKLIITCIYFKWMYLAL